MLRRDLSRLPVHHERLESGLTLLVRPSHAASVVEVQVWALVGSADERPGEEGLAHFHEHMLFKGTPRRGVGEVAGEVEGVGGRMNAFTTFDATVYHATLPAERLATGVDVLADAVQHSLFDPEEIAREIEVVLEEIRRSEDDPHHVLSNAVFREAYRVHPYGAPVLGTRESVARFDRDRVRAFFERWYTPEHLAVVVTGAVEIPRVRDLVRTVFAGPPGATSRERPAEPPQHALRSVLLERPFERATLDLCCPSVPLAHPDAPLLDLLAFVLGEGDSSRLSLRVRDAEQLVDRIEAYSYTPLEPGLFGVIADLDPEHALAALTACAREIERLRDEPVASEELEKARANFLAGEWFDRESVSGLARKTGGFHALGADEERYLDTLRRAGADDLLRAAREHLRSKRLTVGLLATELGFGHDDVVRAVARGRDVTRRTFASPRRGAVRHDIHAFTLAGDARLHVLPRHEVPVVAIRAVFLGGLLAEDARSAGLTSFTTSMWMRGTHHHSAAGFARAVESLAADVDGFAGRNSLGLSLDCLADRLEPALELFAEVLLEPAFAPEEVEKERRETLAALERREDRLAARAFDLFFEALYGDHPYRLPTLGLPETVRSFDAARVAAHHTRLVHPRNLVLTVAGDVDPERIAQALSARLAALPRGPFEPPNPKASVPQRAARERELRKDRAQAHLVLGFPGLTLDDPDRPALEVTTQLLAGQGGRLFLELRDRQGLAYSVSASNVEGVAPGFFAVYIATAPEKLEAARTGLLAELERLLQDAPSEAELDAAREHLVGNHAIDQQRASARALQVALDVLYGLGAEAHLEYPERVRAVSREDVARVARRVIDLDACTVGLVRP